MDKIPGLPQEIRQDQWLKKRVKISSTHYPESGSWIAWSVVFGAQGKAQRRAMAIPFQGVETQPCAAKFRIMEAGKLAGPANLTTRPCSRLLLDISLTHNLLKDSLGSLQFRSRRPCRVQRPPSVPFHRLGIDFLVGLHAGDGLDLHHVRYS